MFGLGFAFAYRLLWVLLMICFVTVICCFSGFGYLLRCKSCFYYDVLGGGLLRVFAIVVGFGVVGLLLIVLVCYVCLCWIGIACLC